MKTVLFFLSVMFLTQMSFAQKTSNLIIFAEDATPFYAIVNGIKQNTEPQTNVKITGLTNPANQVKVILRTQICLLWTNNLFSRNECRSNYEDFKYHKRI